MGGKSFQYTIYDLSCFYNMYDYQMIEQLTTIYLGYLIDIHKKRLMNFEFNPSCLAEKTNISCS